LADKASRSAKKKDGAAPGCESADANPYREATFGETGEDSPQDRKFPQLELLGRGEPIFAQPREESIDLSRGYTDVPLPAGMTFLAL
jgi:hypothetical protein